MYAVFIRKPIIATQCVSLYRKLMDIMLNVIQDIEQFKLFCTVMEKVSDYEPFVNSLRTHLAIQHCEPHIKQMVGLHFLVSKLENQSVITPNEAQNILETTEGKGADNLIVFLRLKEADSHLAFLSCLREGGHHHELVQIIETEINKLQGKGKQHIKFSESRSQESGYFSPANTPAGPVQATDLADGMSKLSVIKENPSQATEFEDLNGEIDGELALLKENYEDGYNRIKMYYEGMRLVLDKMENDAYRELSDLHRAQKLELDAARKNAKKQLIRCRNNCSLEAPLLAKPEAYIKVLTNPTHMHELKTWNIPVVVGPAHHKYTTADGPGLKWACTNKVTSFTVVFRDIQNQPLVTKTYDEMIELTSNFTCTITDNRNSVLPVEQHISPFLPGWVEGIWNIAYVPVVTGVVEVLLKCGGHPITESPFKAMVYPSSHYYGLLTKPQEVLCLREVITGLTVTSSGHIAICTEKGKAYIVKQLAGNECFIIDITSFHGFSLNSPSGITCDGNDNLVVANRKGLQLVKASNPEAKRQQLVFSSKLQFEPVCIGAHDSMVAAGGTQDVLICNSELHILHNINFSASLASLTIASDFSVHVAFSAALGTKTQEDYYNYACITDIDSNTYTMTPVHLLPDKNTKNTYKVQDMIIDKEHNIIVSYANHPRVAVFNSKRELLCSYPDGDDCLWSNLEGDFSAVAVSDRALLLVDHTRQTILESRLDHNLSTIYSNPL